MANENIYPMQITDTTGLRRIVPDHIQHGQAIGKIVGEDGQVIEELQPPSKGPDLDPSFDFAALQALRKLPGIMEHGPTNEVVAEKPALQKLSEEDDPFGVLTKKD